MNKIYLVTHDATDDVFVCSAWNSEEDAQKHIDEFHSTEPDYYIDDRVIGGHVCKPCKTAFL